MLHVAGSASLPYYQSPQLAACPEISHGFFTRRGGVSTGPYRSLNLSFSVGDRPAAVRQNRLLVQQALGGLSLAEAAQVHGSREVLIPSPDRDTGPEIAPADILITAQPGVGLLIRQADCQAVMLYDPVRRVVANVHCGWRGQVQNILGQAVGRLQKIFGTRPGDLYAVIGPSLGPCCAEFRHFHQEFPPHLWAYQVRPTYFDLWRLSRDQLAAAGLQPQRIETAGVCTRCRAEEFYSYRREGLTGRQGAVIALLP
jgi:YfiH family protein